MVRRPERGQWEGYRVHLMWVWRENTRGRRAQAGMGSMQTGGREEEREDTEGQPKLSVYEDAIKTCYSKLIKI